MPGTTTRPLAHTLRLAAAALAAALLQGTVAAATPPQDEVLDALITAAVTGNPAVRAKRSNVEAARHDVDAARWQYAPTLSTQLQRGHSTASQYGSTLRVDQRLYTGGRLASDLDGAASRRDGSLLEVQETALTTAQQVVAGYQSLQAAQAQQQAIAAYRARLEALGGTIARRIDAGVSPQSEQALMNARIAQSANEQASARAAGDSALAALRRLSGVAAVQSSAVLPASVTPADSAAPALCADDEQGDAARAAALDRHPALRRSLQEVASARHTLDSQRAALKPTLTLRFEQPVGAVAPGGNNNARVALVFEYSSEAGLSASSRVDAGGSRLAALSDQSLALRREVEQQIRTECAEHTAVAQRVAGLAQARGFTTDVLGSYTRLFVAGKRAWLDVLNAAREDFDNEQAGLVAAAALRASGYRLALLSGAYPLGQPEPEGAVDKPLAGLLPAWVRR